MNLITVVQVRAQKLLKNNLIQLTGKQLQAIINKENYNIIKVFQVKLMYSHRSKVIASYML